MIKHVSIQLPPYERGFHLITDKVLSDIALPDEGVFHLFIQHTSAGLCINENCDRDVLHDFELYFNRLAPEELAGIKHTVEGPDDMPAHIKSTLVGSSISIPIIKGKLALGVWQGIYLCEFRDRARSRSLIATIWT